MVPHFNDFLYFLEIADTQNVSRAAERLGISQPSLSTSIKRLEDALGTQLLVRNKSGVRLTKDGHFFVTRVKSLVTEWESIRDGIQRASEEVSGRYKLGCHATVAHYGLPQFLPQLLEKHPKLEIELHHDLSRKICEKIISFELDMGLVVNPVAHPDLVIKEVCTDTIQFWVSSRKRLASPDVLLCDPSLLQTQDLLLKLRKKNVKFQRTLTSSSLEVIARLVDAGTGVGVLPTRAAEIYALKPFNKTLPVFHDRICAVYRADMPKTRAVVAILEHMKKIE